MCLIIPFCVNSISVCFVILVLHYNNEVNFWNIIIFICLIVIGINVRFTFLYFKEVRSVNTKLKTFCYLSKNAKRKYNIILLVLSVICLFGFFLFFIKGLVLIGIGIMITSGYALIYFLKSTFKGLYDSNGEKLKTNKKLNTFLFF